MSSQNVSMTTDSHLICLLLVENYHLKLFYKIGSFYAGKYLKSDNKKHIKNIMWHNRKSNWSSIFLQVPNNCQIDGNTPFFLQHVAHHFMNMPEVMVCYKFMKGCFSVKLSTTRWTLLNSLRWVDPVASTDKSILKRTDSVLRSNDKHSQAYKWLTNYNTGTVIVTWNYTDQLFFEFSLMHKGSLFLLNDV